MNGDAAAELAEPVDAHGVEEVVAERVRDLVARLAAAARPVDGERIARGALEAAVLLAHVGERVVERPGELLIERRGEDPDAELLRLAAQVAPQLAHAIELLAARARRATRWRPSPARCSPAARTRDVRPRPASVNCSRRLEVEVERAGLVHVARVGDVDGRVEAVAEDRAVPVEVRPNAARRREVAREQRDVRRVAGEHAARAAVGAARRNRAMDRPRTPPSRASAPRRRRR